MADLKISQLTSATTPLAGTEVLPIVQSGSTKKIAISSLASGAVKSNATTGVLQVAGPAAGATRVMTVPDANFTVARTDSTNTFASTQTVIGDVIAQGYGARYLKIQSLDSAAYRMAVKLSADEESLVITGPNDYKVLAVTGYSTPDTTRIYANNAEQLRITASATSVLNGNMAVSTAGKGYQLPGSVTWTSGSGSPEGVVTAPVGSLFSRTDGGAGTSLYVKQSGSGNTGWVGK